MKEQLISFETAKLAKEKGFDEPTLYCCGNFEPMLSPNEDVKRLHDGLKWNSQYKNEHLFACPTQSLLQKWLREKHEINLWMATWGENNEFYHVEDITRGLGRDMIVIGSGGKGSIIYEEALEEGLFEALKLL